MTKIYLKPETITIEMEQQQNILAGSNLSIITSGEPINGGAGLSKETSFDFTPIEEQEESTRVSTTNEEDWDEFEEEE